MQNSSLPFLAFTMKIGVALGGGGAKGFAHIGVLEGLEQYICPDYLSGTSFGAVVGALYALYPSGRKVKRILRNTIERHKKEIFILEKFSSSDELNAKKIFLERSYDFIKDLVLWNLRVIKNYLVDPKPFIKIFKEIYQDKEFSDCKIPFSCTTVDLNNGEVIYLNEGPLYRAVLMSSLLPGFFPPLKIGKRLFTDGGVLEPVPVNYLRQKAEFVIAVNLEAGINTYYKQGELKSAIDVMSAVDILRYKEIVEVNTHKADFVITPALDIYSWADFTKFQEIIAVGKKAFLQNKEDLLVLIKRQRRKTFFKHLFLR